MPLWQVTVGGGGNAPPSEILREMLRGLQAAPNFFSSARGDQTQNIGRLGLTAGGLGRPWRSMLLRGWGPEVQLQHEARDSLCVNVMDRWNAFLTQHPGTPDTAVELQQQAKIKLVVTDNSDPDKIGTFQRWRPASQSRVAPIGHIGGRVWVRIGSKSIFCWNRSIAHTIHVRPMCLGRGPTFSPSRS